MVRIYHHPRCSKSREPLAFLRERGIVPEVVLYPETPPDAKSVKTLLQQLGMRSARDLMRRKEELYQELKLAESNLSEDQLVQTLVELSPIKAADLRSPFT